MADNGDWCLIESDPGVFTELIRGFGCTGYQVEELYTLDENAFKSLRPVHGLIFLFKWKAGDEPSGPIVKDSRLDNIFFAKQVISNACATQAILSILLNTQHPDVDLGPILTEFREFSASFDANLKGLTLTNSNAIRQVHNSFSRQQVFEIDGIQPKKDEDVFHFIAYVPVNNRLYELDGLREGPIDLGPCTSDTWLNEVKPVIERRIQKYSSEEIHFNLMAVVSDRKQAFLKEIEALNHQKRQLLEQGAESMEIDSTTSLQNIEANIAKYQGLVAAEDDKMLRYKVENVRRKHNYLPLIVELLKVLGKEGKLVALVEKARQAKPKKLVQEEL
ncbi:ubiquitin carboxyl-terminal hydrolase isozyme L5-like [Dendronephthya gigantea]|uniref:ubiquitin carboxyl-terminal hydrolase isozyme L5-like n=1 Tax=Dendronephthya gigantea TaxID=151771 RepID=UPI00106C3898|nr:ubiquitin carboxyl-terminal hydrolase isozyme L5-like [Dendronephthya gigantea]